MVKHLPLYGLALAMLFSCKKTDQAPANVAFSGTYVLDRVEKELPQFHTKAGTYSGYSHALTRVAPFTQDTLTAIRAITFFQQRQSEITTQGTKEEKSYYSVKSLDKSMEFIPANYGIYYTFNPKAPGIFTPASDQELVQSGLNMKADLYGDGIVLTKYVLAFKDDIRYKEKVDENFLDPANRGKLQAGDTLITMKYYVYLKRNQ